MPLFLYCVHMNLYPIFRKDFESLCWIIVPSPLLSSLSHRLRKKFTNKHRILRLRKPGKNLEKRMDKLSEIRKEKI